MSHRTGCFEVLCLYSAGWGSWWIGDRGGGVECAYTTLCDLGTSVSQTCSNLGSLLYMQHINFYDPAKKSQCIEAAIPQWLQYLSLNRRRYRVDDAVSDATGPSARARLFSFGIRRSPIASTTRYIQFICRKHTHVVYFSHFEQFRICSDPSNRFQDHQATIKSSTWHALISPTGHVDATLNLKSELSFSLLSTCYEIMPRRTGIGLRHFSARTQGTWLCCNRAVRAYQNGISPTADLSRWKTRILA